MRNKGVSRGEIPATTIHHLEYYFCNDFSPSGFLNLFVIDQRKHANCTYTYTLIFHKLASRGFCLTVYKLCFVLRELVVVTRSKY